MACALLKQSGEVNVMNDSTDKMAALDWSMPEEFVEEDCIEIDLEPANGSDGEVWEWNGSAWVAVRG